MDDLRRNLAGRLTRPDVVAHLLTAGIVPDRLAVQPADLDRLPPKAQVLVAATTDDPAVAAGLTAPAHRSHVRWVAAGNPACPADVRLALLEEMVLGRDCEPEDPDLGRIVGRAVACDPDAVAALLAEQPRRPRDGWLAALVHHGGVGDRPDALARLLAGLGEAGLPDSSWRSACDTVDRALSEITGWTPQVGMALLEHVAALPAQYRMVASTAAVGRRDSDRGELDLDRLLALHAGGGILPAAWTARSAVTAELKAADAARVAALGDPDVAAWALEGLSQSTDPAVRPDAHVVLTLAAVALAGDPDPDLVDRVAAYVSRAVAVTFDDTVAARHGGTLAALAQVGRLGPQLVSAAVAHPDQPEWLVLLDVVAGDDPPPAEVVPLLLKVARARPAADHPVVGWAAGWLADPAVADAYLGDLQGSGAGSEAVTAAAVATRPATAVATFAGRQWQALLAELLAPAFDRLATPAAFDTACALLEDGWDGTLDALVDTAGELG